MASILDYIDKGRWKSAVFTTFTLSLTYLESHVLPRLRQRGCESLHVFADTAGYRDSLIERRAQAIGRDYSVVPVLVRTGIFHPKLIHLHAAEGDADLLLVGSGNLTYSGHGGNVEVLDALTPAKHKTAYKQAAEFMRRLVANHRVDIPDPNALVESADRLEDVASRGGDEGNVEFIDSLDRSGFVQFAERAQQISPTWDELVVLSPYHHHKAQPVRKLVDALGAKKLVVGVSTANEPSPFPFDEELGVAVTTQRPVVPQGTNRRLHAKWFEVRNHGHALTLTGSFNATLQSFCSTDNVECGVLRHSAVPLDSWETCARPPHAPMEFPERDGVAATCVFAKFESPSTITGRLLGAQDFSGRWTVRLDDADHPLRGGTVDVTGDGAFAWTFVEAVDDVDIDSLQISLEQGGQQARGWVQVSRVLKLSASDRHLLQSVNRVAKGTSELSDAVGVVEYLAKEAASILERSPGQSNASQRTGQTLEGAVAGADGEALTSEEFQALRDPWGESPVYQGGFMLNALARGSQGWETAGHICAALLGDVAGALKQQPGTQRGPARWLPIVGGSRGAGDSEEPESKKEQNAKRRLERALDNAVRAFGKQLDIADQIANRATTKEQLNAVNLGRSRLLDMACRVEIRFRVSELEDSDRAYEKIWRWFRLLADLELQPSQRRPLEPLVCGIAASCACWLLNTQWRAGDPVHAPLQINRLLGKFFYGHLQTGEIIDLARSWLLTPLGSALIEGQQEQATSALQMVLEEPTELQILAKVLSEGFQKNRDLALRVFGRDHFPKVEEFLGGMSGAPKYWVVDVQSLQSCPAESCGVTLCSKTSAFRFLESEYRWRLRQLGFVRANCGHFLVARGAQ
jgi:hypothetical protein